VPADGQRWIRITLATFAEELARFARKEHRFASEARLNDMWLEIDFDDVAFERAVGEYLIRILAKRYSPFRTVELKNGGCCWSISSASCGD